MKKLYILIASIACGIVSMNAADGNWTTGANLTIDGLKYTSLADGTMKFDGIENITGFVDLRYNVKYGFDTYDITVIGKDAFSGNPYLTGVMLPDNITTIEAGAFNNCYMLKGITIPAGVTSMGHNEYYTRPVFEYTPLEVISFMGSKIPEGDLSLIFNSQYINQIIIPADMADAYEKAYPSIKEGRIKVTMTVDPEVFGFDFRIGSSFLMIAENSTYPVNIVNSSAELPLNAVIYSRPDTDLIFLSHTDLVGGGGYKISVDGKDDFKWAVGPTLPSSFYANLEYTDPSGRWKSSFGVSTIGGLHDGSKIELIPSWSEVTTIPSDLPETFAIFSIDGQLVKSVAKSSDLNTLPKNIYILKGTDSTVKVIAGK